MLPPKDALTIGFAHSAYDFRPGVERRQMGVRHFHVAEREALLPRLAEVDVLVVSGLWQDAMLAAAPKLRFIQSIGAGTDQFGRGALAQRGVRLASASGANVRAVSEHALALMLALARRLGEARDHQARHHWRGMVRNLSAREDELRGKTLLIVGLGNIGQRLAVLAKALEMRVLGLRRDPARGQGAADAVHGMAALHDLLPEADVVALTCPLTAETENLIDARALRRMKPTAHLINVARGRVVAEAELVAAMRAGVIAGAAIDVTPEEPLPAHSPLWDLPNTLITPHTAGETRAYEENVLDILEDNLARLWRGEAALRNQVV